MHQDAWSKYIYTPSGSSCPPLTQTITGFHESDGAPQWASAHLTPVCAIESVRDLDAAVQEDFQRLYSDSAGPDGVGLQEHYAAAVTALAERFARNPAVAGYELLNEPEPGFVPAGMDVTELFPFYAKLIGTVLDRVKGFHQLFFIEPDITRDLTDHSFIVTPWSLFSGYRNVVYAPHIYTSVFTLDSELHAPALSPLFPASGGYDSAEADARALGLPLWVGEFGGPVSADQTLLRAQYANQDRLEVGGALWYWKGSTSYVWSVVVSNGFPYPSRLELTDRAYPIYTDGSLQALSYDPYARRFDLRASGATSGGAPTVIYLPATIAGRISASGARVRLVRLGRGAREAFVYPNRNSYEVSGA
jgi:endoglycosylceramidase